MDEQIILTGLPLRLNPALQRSVPSKGLSVLSCTNGAGELLTLSDRQYEVLRAFLNPGTVPDVLRVLILRRAAVPLREFYELVLKAYRAGILISDRSEDLPVPTRWRWLRISHLIFILPAWIAATVAIVWVALQGLPLHWQDTSAWPYWLGGWGLSWLAISLGDVFAACVLSYLRESAPRPAWHWWSPYPRWRVNLDEAKTLLRWERVGVYSARLFPLATLAVSLATLLPATLQGLAVAPLVALLFELRPFGTGTLMPVLSALFQGEILDTQHSLIFSLNRRWWVRFRFGLARLTFTYVAFRLLLAAGWVVLLVAVSLRLAGSGIWEVYSDQHYWLEVARLFALWLVGVTVLALLPPLFRRSRRTVKRRSRSLGHLFRHWLAKDADVASHPAVLKLMAASPAFRRLNPTNRLALVAAGEVRRLAVKKRFGTETSPLPLGMILSGRVAIYRTAPGGKPQRVAIYVEGDVLGTETWSDPDGGAVQVVPQTPVILLEWTPQVFGERVIAELGPQVACDLFVKVPFLRGLRLCRGWHPQSLVRFAQIARFSTFEHGHPVLAEGEAVLWFFVLYSGGASSRKKNGSRAWLTPGDFFGEISLMRQDVATADVLTEGMTRCLLVHRPEFLRFMTHNPIAAIEVEAVSSVRFGRPVFPYTR